MLNLRFNVIVFMLPLFITGCLQTDEEKKQKGTVKAVSICINKNEKHSELFSKKLIKNQCIKKHEQKILNHFGGYKSAYVFVENDSIKVDIERWEHTLDNFIITSVNVEAYYYEADGIKKSFSKWKSGLWIEPNTIKAVSIPISFSIPYKKKRKISHWCLGQKEKRNCKGWNTLGFKGVKIKLNL